jgi:hypothetical protein
MNTVEHIRIDRDTMIEHLTGSMFDSMECDADYRWLLCQTGFKGFNNYTDEELIQEYRDYISEDESYPVIIELIEEQ